MAKIPIQFTYQTGIAGNVLEGVRAILRGSWDRGGRYSGNWTSSGMTRDIADDGCLCFHATVTLDEEEKGRWFNWGVAFVYPDGREIWAIPTEVKDRASREQHRPFLFSGKEQAERYYLTHCRRLGANKYHRADGGTGIRFAVWAPNARKVEVVIGTIWDQEDPLHRPASHSLPFQDIAGGYISDDGTGIHPNLGPFQMHQNNDGVWETSLDDPALADFKAFDHKPYMFRITKDDGGITYRTDLYSRCQIGFGRTNPKGAPYANLTADLDGTVSCSVVVDPERVTQYFAEEPPYLPSSPPAVRVWPELHFVDDTEFWKDEYDKRAERRPPSRVQDLIIYDLHVGALGFGSTRPGTLADALRLLDHLVLLGVNAVELLPMCEFSGGAENWGYATSHHCAIEFGGGGRDQYKFFVKEAHRRGIAVIMDVVYNHYAHDAERAEWMYDSNAHERNIYYWYEGKTSDYPNPVNGYVENQSTADAPRYYEEIVRKLFISSAVALMQEFHVDGFRVDQTTSIHNYNRQRIGGAPEVSDANIFGAKLLREFSRALRLLRPEVMLIAEDHSTWHEVTLPIEAGGMGFDARWYSDFCHHLEGDTKPGDKSYAKLLYTAAMSDNEPLRMDWFSGALLHSGSQCIVYHESHDEAGNSKGPFYDPEFTPNVQDPKTHTSQRTIVVAVNQAPLFGLTRRYAEARCRFTYGLTVFSAGTPMLLFGEEVGAERRFKYNAVLENKEDLHGLCTTTGAKLFNFYCQANRLRLDQAALRSHNVEVVHTHNENRVIALRRWDATDQFLIIASLNNQPFVNGYLFQHPSLSFGRWQETFNSDATAFGGDNVGNLGAVLNSDGRGLNVVVPANGFVVLRLLST